MSPQEPGASRRTIRRPRPSQAFGLGLRRPHFDEIFQNHRGVDFLELICENFMDFGGRTREVLERAKGAFPIVVHGVSMSVGGPDPLREDYLDRLKEFIGFVKPPWFSDHLCYTSGFGVEYHDLMQLPFTEEAVRHVVERIKRVQARMGIPFLVENISYYAVMPGDMTEAEFTREVVTRADCGLLLDVNNVFVNSTNHGYDPQAFIDAMPADRVLQYHMGGHDASGPFIVDTHSRPVPREVLDLYAYTLRKIGPAWTLLEWDNDIPELDVLLAENEKVRNTAAGALAEGGEKQDKGGMLMTSNGQNPRITLHETFETMHRLLRREITPAEASTRLGCVEDRIALYPEFVLDHVRSVLVKNFPALAGLFSAADWEGIVQEYFRTHPPDHYEMNANAARFPAFLHALAGQGRFGIVEFHLELAEVEWLEWTVFASPERIPLPVEVEEPMLNPTLAVLELNFPVVEYLKTWDRERARGFPAGVPPVPDEARGGIAFVFRHPGTHEAIVRDATDPDLFAFKVVHESIPLDRAAEEARIPLSEAEALLLHAERAGFVLLPIRAAS